MGWEDLVSKGVDFFGGAGAARGSASEAKRAAEEEQRRYEARKAAYQDMINRSKGDFTTGEQAFTQEATTALPELQTMEQQAATLGSQALQDTAGQMQLGLAQQGLRGGQAATQLRRGLGEVGKGTQQNINKMKFDEANQRAGERRQYQSGKAARGQQSSYTPPNF